MKNNRKIVLDTETTGLDYLYKDRIIEIAAIEIFDDIYQPPPNSKEFHFYLKTEVKLDEKASEIHGITEDFLKDKPLFKDICKNFLEFVGDSQIVAHNAEFDRRMINLELGLIGEKYFPKERFIDTFTMAKLMYPNDKLSLDSLCFKFNIDTSSREKHGALIDTRLLAKVFEKMISEIDLSSDFKTSVDNFYGHNKVKKEFKVQNFPSRKFDVNKEELQQHQEWLKKIKNPIWLKD